jgi:ADP-ribosylglycohydrolase
MALTLENRIRGCLTGAFAGTELGMQRILIGEPKVGPADAGKALTAALPWRKAPAQDPRRTSFVELSPLLTSVAKTYLARGGRITAEEWGAELARDKDINESTSFWLMDIHTTVELLREGMNARVSGYCAMPSGNACMAAIPVGIYHAGDPDMAYVDGVEIASVTQRAPGSDWAALTASAVAAALLPDATPESVIDQTLRVALRRTKDAYYDLNHLVRVARSFVRPGASAAQGREDFARFFAQANTTQKHAWLGDDPIGWALAVLAALGDDPALALRVSVILDAYPSMRSPVLGAILGALKGEAVFPQEWRTPVAARVDALAGLAGLVKRKLSGEKVVIGQIEELAKSRPGADSLLVDKVYGCILAGAIGNAMGSVVEGKHYDEIDTMHPGGVKTILDPSRLESEDDNQMAMLLTETYIEREGFNVTARDFGDMWRRKLNRDHFFYCMKNSLDLIHAGLDARIVGHWNIVTGSTAMCMEPAGTYHLCDPVNAYVDGTAISYMYQRGLDVVAAAILAASVAAAFRPDATVGSVLKAALDASPKTKMITFDTRKIDTPYQFISLCLEVADKYTDVLAARKELYEKCLYYHMIDPLEYVGLSYAMFKIAKGDVRQAAIGGTNIGRDSDTISGRAAMLSGTLKGSAGIPKEWIAMFRPESLEKIRTNAGRIADLIVKRKLPVMRERQTIS